MSLRAKSVTVIRSRAQILAGVSLEVEPGQIIGLIGPNGAGKSTLLKVCAGNETLNSGKVTMEGTPISSMSPNMLARRRAVMMQSSILVFDFLVIEVLSLGWLKDGNGKKADMAASILEIIELCDIASLTERVYRTLSGGEQQRVQFARALLQIWAASSEREARYLLLDEPTSSLDVGHELLLFKILTELKARHVGIMVVMHDLNLASHFADELCLLAGGELISKGTVAAVLNEKLLSSAYATPIRVEFNTILGRAVVHTH